MFIIDTPSTSFTFNIITIRFIYFYFVYFSAYNGYVYKMSRDTYQITDSVKVGAYPEAIAIANGKLYAALSNYDMKGNGK